MLDPTTYKRNALTIIAKTFTDAALCRLPLKIKEGQLRHFKIQINHQAHLKHILKVRRSGLCVRL